MAERRQLIIKLRAELEQERAKPRLISALEPRDELNNRLCIALVSEVERVMTDLTTPKLKPSERCQLIGALDRLLDRLRILRGDPLPGSSRPKEEKPASAAVSMLGQSVTSSDARPGREDQD